MPVSSVERSSEAEDTKGDDLSRQEVLVCNVSGKSATKTSHKSVPNILLAIPPHVFRILRWYKVNALVDDVLEVYGSDLLGGLEGPGGTESGSSEEGHCE